MKKYLNHLIDDIKNAHRPADYFSNEQHLSEKAKLEKQNEELDRFIEGDYGPPFYEACGLDPLIFPPADKLSIEDRAAIVDAMTAMYLSWNIQLEMVEHISEKLIYELNVKALSEPILIVEFGDTVWDFCEGDIEGCVFGEHCYCKYYEAQDKAETEFATNWFKEFNETMTDEILDKSGPIVYTIEPDHSKLNGEMHHFISNGYPGLPINTTFMMEEFEESCEIFKKLFANYPEIVEFLNRNEFPAKLKFVHDFLQLEASRLADHTFLIEPFRIENNELVVASKLVSPEDLMKRLEEGEEDELPW